VCEHGEEKGGAKRRGTCRTAGTNPTEFLHLNEQGEKRGKGRGRSGRGHGKGEVTSVTMGELAEKNPLLPAGKIDREAGRDCDRDIDLETGGWTTPEKSGPPDIIVCV